MGILDNYIKKHNEDNDFFDKDSKNFVNKIGGFFKNITDSTIITDEKISEKDAVIAYLKETNQYDGIVTEMNKTKEPKSDNEERLAEMSEEKEEIEIEEEPKDEN